MDKIVYLWNAKTDNHSPGPFTRDVLSLGRFGLVAHVYGRHAARKRQAFCDPRWWEKVFWGVFPH